MKIVPQSLLKKNDIGIITLNKIKKSKEDTDISILEGRNKSALFIDPPLLEFLCLLLGKDSPALVGSGGGFCNCEISSLLLPDIELVCLELVLGLHVVELYLGHLQTSTIFISLAGSIQGIY
jgi:hypothetical protein